MWACCWAMGVGVLLPGRHAGMDRLRAGRSGSPVRDHGPKRRVMLPHLLWSRLGVVPVALPLLPSARGRACTCSLKDAPVKSLSSSITLSAKPSASGVEVAVSAGGASAKAKYSAADLRKLANKPTALVDVARCGAGACVRLGRGRWGWAGDEWGEGQGGRCTRCWCMRRGWAG